MVANKTFWDKVDETNFFLFDFDGTLYPGNLLLDLSTEYFLQNMPEQYDTLVSLVNSQNNLTFSEIQTKFAKLLTDIECDLFYKDLDKHLKKCYPLAIKFIGKLNELGKECFLVSLTSSRIANRVKEKFKFVDILCRPLEYHTYNGKICFLGQYIDEISNLSKYKKSSLNKFGIDEKKYFMAGDSKEDLDLFSSANIRVATNMAEDHLKLMHFDLILSNKSDPWGAILD